MAGKFFRIRSLLFLLTLIPLWLSLFGCGQPPAPPQPIQPYAGEKWDGMNFAIWWDKFNNNGEAFRSADRMINAGAKSVTIVVNRYIDNKTSADIKITRQTADNEQLRALIRHFHARGVRVNLKPHVDSLDHTFRGEIEPDWSPFFKNYRGYLNEYADLAREEKVELFTIGTELTSTHKQQAEWEQTIAEVRGRFPGKLTYAADWNGFESFPCWDKLDYAGIDSYFPLSPKSDPSPYELYQAWQIHIKKIEKWQKGHGKPLIFTEQGFRSATNAAREPWDWKREVPADNEIQKNLYLATYLAFLDKPYIAGQSYWAWPASLDQPLNPKGFEFIDKPAEGIVRGQWQNRNIEEARRLKAHYESGRLLLNSEEWKRERDRLEKDYLDKAARIGLEPSNGDDQLKLLTLQRDSLKTQYRDLIANGSTASSTQPLLDKIHTLEAEIQTLTPR